MTLIITSLACYARLKLMISDVYCVYMTQDELNELETMEPASAACRE